VNSSMIGVPLLKHKDSFLGLSNSHFVFIFPMICFRFPIFSHVKWNDFIPNSIYPFRFYFFHLWKKNSEIYPMWAMFYQWPKIIKNLIFLNLLHCNRAFGFCHSYILYRLFLKVFVVRILGQKYFFKDSLWVFELFFSYETKSWNFFRLW